MLPWRPSSRVIGERLRLALAGALSHALHGTLLPQAPSTTHTASPSPTRPAHPPRQVLDRVRAVAAAKGKHIATMLDTKGPEIRTAMLKGGGPLELKVCGSMPRHAL